MKYRDLEIVRLIIHEATGLDISYAYDDLVFPDQTAFLFRFDPEIVDTFHCYFRDECPDEDRRELLHKINNAGNRHSCRIINSGEFMLRQKGEMVQIEFKE